MKRPSPVRSGERAHPETARLQQLTCGETIDEFREGRLEALRREVAAEVERYKKSAAQCMSEFAERDTRKRAMSARARSFGGSGPQKYLTANSKTNLIAVGVDESDMVKHDGRHIYVLAQGVLHILAVDADGSPTDRDAPPRTSDYLRPLSSTWVGEEAKTFYLSEGRVVTLGGLESTTVATCKNNYGCFQAGDGSKTRLRVLDVSNKSAPRKVREVTLSGALLESRRIGQTIHLVTIDDYRPALNIDLGKLPACYVPGFDDLIEARAKRAIEENTELIESTIQPPTWTEDGTETLLCSQGHQASARAPEVFLTLSSFDLTKKEPPRAMTLVSPPGAIHVSASHVYVAVPGELRTDLHTFAVGDTPESTRYEGSGLFRGVVFNNFSMDEHDGVLRVVTARESGAALTTLALSPEEEWVQLGEVSGLAQGEELRAVRFDGQRAFAVTYLRKDPLYTLDLKDPRAPRVVGELVIPGFSTYLHVLDDAHLLSVGYDVDSRGRAAGVMVQMFDVENLARPRLLHRKWLGASGSKSTAALDHHAFVFLPEEGLLVLPLTLCTERAHAYFAGLEVFEVDVRQGFQELGRLAHSSDLQHKACQKGFREGEHEARRAVVVSGLVASIGAHSIQAQRLDRLTEQPGALKWPRVPER